MGLKSLMSSFVTFDETPAVENKVSSRPTMTTPIPVPPPQIPYVYASGQAISPDIKKHLMSIIMDNNQDGFDYCEFMVQLETLSQFAISNEQKYRSSFAALVGQAQLAKKDFTKEILISSITLYKKLIQKAVDGFNAEFDQTFKLEVDDKKALVITKATEMQSLSEQMNKLQSEIQELNIAINSTESNLKQNKELFVNTGNTVMGELDAESEKINNYII